MKPQSHLLIAIHNRSWGRTEMAVRVAQNLRAAGDKVHFLLHAKAAPLLSRTGFPYDCITDHIRGLARQLLDSIVQRTHPRNIIYFDFFNTSNYLLQLGIHDTNFLLDYDCATMTLDTWDYRLTGHQLDLFGNQEGSLVFGDIQNKIAEFNRIPHRLIPVPVASCDDQDGKFDCLPLLSVARNRNCLRNQLGIPYSHRIILFCTATWQQISEEGNENGQRMSTLLPNLIAAYVRQMKSMVHLVHVGPHSYGPHHELGERYHWLPQVGRLEFEQLIGSVDLLLSANTSATTIAMAISLQVPVIVLENSQTIQTLEEALALTGRKPSQSVRACLLEAMPIYPFTLWPLGYYDFLRPLLKENSYCNAFDTVELVDESTVIERCEKLLNDSVAREEMVERQCRYAQEVRKLPTAAEVIHGFLQ